jgi:hypothetical protein
MTWRRSSRRRSSTPSSAASSPIALIIATNQLTHFINSFSI